MGDFLIDFRPQETREREGARTAALLQFCSASKISALEEGPFSVTVSRTDDPALWSPGEAKGVVVALAGRLAFSEEEWNAAKRIPGTGGAACRRVAQMFSENGVACFERLNGNFAVLIYDRQGGRVYVGSDRFGMTLCYGVDGTAADVIGTHPDTVAALAGEEENYDLDSFAQFIAAGHLTFPETFYRKIKALEFGSVHVFDVAVGEARHVQSRRFHSIQFKGEQPQPEDALAEELAKAFKKSVQLRSLPLLGKTAVALSGGMDSRAILSSVSSGKQTEAFTLFDEENAETRAAQGVGRALGVETQMIRRGPDYYGETFRDGAAILGGVGCLASNHFLGIRERLESQKIESLLTGCYCDYLFKGLAQNTTESRFIREEKPAPFAFSFYRAHYQIGPKRAEAVRGRFQALFGIPEGKMLSESESFEVERKRSLPLAYEADCAQRQIPQRVMPWNPPIADNGLMDVYQKIPSSYKRNGSIFRKMLAHLCPKELMTVPDSNLGMPVGSSKIVRAVGRYASALQNRIHSALRPGMSTRGSWPNWEFYMSRSASLRGLWEVEDETAASVFNEILPEGLQSLTSYTGSRVELALRVLTLKAWLLRPAALEKEPVGAATAKQNY